MSTKKKCKRDSSRGLDAKIAQLLGLEVYKSHEGYLQAGFPHAMQWSSAVQYPAYWCKDHKVALVVPLYHQSLDLAVWALEQICDERLLVVDPYRVPGGEWVVELTAATGNEEPIAYGRDKSLTLAICKALVELGEKE